MDLHNVRVEIPEGGNVIIGQAHFIKTVEDVYEAIVTTNPQMRFGVAFNEASQERLIRHDGNDPELVQCAIRNAQAIGAGHLFVVVMQQGFPITVLPRIREVQEVVRIFCATANPLEVIVIQTAQGRGVVGVVDGESPAGVEGEEQIAYRKSLLRKIGYKR
ncbi:MAG: adenosine monophosphate-protein transferase [Acidobacteria bacterium]|nr:adenosine monophosphate-protein transferase [Acidobacteriota bacterium]